MCNNRLSQLIFAATFHSLALQLCRQIQKRYQRSFWELLVLRAQTRGGVS